MGLLQYTATLLGSSGLWNVCVVWCGVEKCGMGAVAPHSAVQCGVPLCSCCAFPSPCSACSSASACSFPHPCSPGTEQRSFETMKTPTSVSSTSPSSRVPKKPNSFRSVRRSSEGSTPRCQTPDPFSPVLRTVCPPLSAHCWVHTALCVPQNSRTIVLSPALFAQLSPQFTGSRLKSMSTRVARDRHRWHTADKEVGKEGICVIRRMGQGGRHGAVEVGTRLKSLPLQLGHGESRGGYRGGERASEPHDDAVFKQAAECGGHVAQSLIEGPAKLEGAGSLSGESVATFDTPRLPPTCPKK